MKTIQITKQINWTKSRQGTKLPDYWIVRGVEDMESANQELVVRQVGEESRRTYCEKLRSGFFDLYMSGKGLDVGYAGYLENIDPILPGAIGVDMDYPGYDGKTLPFDDGSLDYVYSSHTLEHIEDYKNAIQDWYRVVKVGGHLVIAVPSAYTYEKKLAPPSQWNGDHKRFYTPSSLLREVEESLAPNSYRVVRYEEHWPSTLLLPPEKHSNGPYEYELVIKKVEKPKWEVK